MKKTQRLVQWFGANTENAWTVGELLVDCRFVAIPFGGGMSEVPGIGAKQILVNDLHRHVINLCNVVRSDELRQRLARDADSLPYHPDVLASRQQWVADWTWNEGELSPMCYPAALWYFICVWMGRGGKAGTEGEFSGKLPVRWNANGGGSNRRYRTAIEALDDWGVAFRRCEFVCLDGLDFIRRFEDRPEHGLYVDAPWPGVGDAYVHKFDEQAQRDLAQLLAGIAEAEVVVRYGEHPLIRELYPESVWTWIPLESRTQTNERKAEFLIIKRER